MNASARNVRNHNAESAQTRVKLACGLPGVVDNCYGNRVLKDLS